MGKRFTATEKWRDPWFFPLSLEHKCLWLWLCDNCDNAGVVDIIWPILTLETGHNFSEADMDAFGDRVRKMENGKWHLVKFVSFQFGPLSKESRVHQSVEKLMRQHSLSIGYRMAIDRTKDKEKVKDKDSVGDR